MSWSICQRNRTRREQGEVSERRVQIKNGHQAFVSVYYNNADKEIQFHWYRLKVQYTKRFMANLKMIPQYPKKPQPPNRLKRGLTFFGSFFFLFLLVAVEKDSCSWPRYSTKLSNTCTHRIYILLLCRCRFKDTRYICEHLAENKRFLINAHHYTFHYGDPFITGIVISSHPWLALHLQLILCGTININGKVSN